MIFVRTRVHIYARVYIEFCCLSIPTDVCLEAVVTPLFIDLR